MMSPIERSISHAVEELLNCKGECWQDGASEETLNAIQQAIDILCKAPKVSA